MTLRTGSVLLLIVTCLGLPGCYEQLHHRWFRNGSISGWECDGHTACSCDFLCEHDQADRWGDCASFHFDRALHAELCGASDADYSPPRSVRNARMSLEAPPETYFQLGSYGPAESPRHEVGVRTHVGQFEAREVRVQYPHSFTFTGFDTYPRGAQIGSIRWELGAPGSNPGLLPIRAYDAASAYVSPVPVSDPVDLPSVRHEGGNEFTVTLPDSAGSPLVDGLEIGVTIALWPALFVNPWEPGSYTIEASLLDPETGEPALTVAATPEIRMGPCPAAPARGCNTTFGKASLALRAGEDPGASRLSVKARGGDTYDGFFGEPAERTSHATCVYDGSDALIAELEVRSGGTDGKGRPLWRQKKARSAYKFRSGNRAGVRQVKQRSGAKASFAVKARGESLSLPPLPLEGPITVQHRTSDQGCAEVVLDDLARNDAGSVKARKR